jgi:hypothetical protein
LTPPVADGAAVLQLPDEEENIPFYSGAALSVTLSLMLVCDSMKTMPPPTTAFL